MPIMVSALRTTKTESKSGASARAEGHGELKRGSKGEVRREGKHTSGIGSKGGRGWRMCWEERKALQRVEWVGYLIWGTGRVRCRLRHWWMIGKGIEGGGGAMDVNAAVAGEGGRGREIVMYVLWGGMVVESGDGKVTYEGGSRKCMVVREGTGAEELFKMVRKMTGSDKSEEKLWYNLRYDREMLVPVEVDSDVEVIFKGNDEHGYLYVSGNAGPVRREHARAAVCEARERDTGEGKQIGKSGRKCNDVQEVGEERGNNKAGVKQDCRSVGVEGGEQPGRRLCVGEDAIELPNDDEISVASEDAGDAKAAEEDNAGDEGAAQKKCGEGSKREGGHLEKLGKNMDHHKTEMLKWKNGVGEKIEQKLADTYKNMGCIAAVECYSLMQWQMRYLPCCHALAVIAKANLWVYDYVHPIYKTAMQEVIYNQLVHPMKTHDIGVEDGRTGLVAGGNELDEDYNQCILPPNNGRHPGRPSSK
ncbi:hypothetical protein Cgig2_014409 [Carnegiea gigantea]|uniref:Zinc finger PMZ-type domain-containing protein n=1 Tax=Carnegiea gigantea TaxID=171969 RepID=A0A9Q1GT26_9CARY|nr:hypothetical protein Cgig2_014409 [Carnegiea gigantea]